MLDATDVAVIYRGRKLILDGDQQDAMRHAYDLNEDPGERSDRAADDSFKELRGGVDSALHTVRTPLLGREDSVISDEQRANLDALGYGGDAQDD